MSLQKLQKKDPSCLSNSHAAWWIGMGITTLAGITGSLFFLQKRAIRPTRKIIDIEIRYDVPSDTDATFLAQNLVKIIRMVLSPLQSKVNSEGATLIFVLGDNCWEMRVRNGSEKLRKSVSRLLESKKWQDIGY